MASMATTSSLHLRAPCSCLPLLFRRGRPSPSRGRNRESFPASSGAPRRWRCTSRLPLRGSSVLLPSGQMMICRVRSQEDGAERPSAREDEEVQDLGVKVALSMLRFYKREISPLLPSSCRYVPSCSEYSMQAYKKYGVAKGTILTAWRLCRCNPLGGSGFDPPRWFDEDKPTED